MNNDYLLREELRSAGYTGSINQAIRNVLTDAGITGQLNEAMRQFFNELGYTGHYSEQMKQWKAAGYPLTAFNQNLEAGYLFANIDDNASGVLTGYSLSNSNTSYALNADATAGRITVGKEGNYLIFGNSFPYAATGNNIDFQPHLRLNGTSYAIGASLGNFSHGDSAGAISIATLSEADYIDLQLVNDGRSLSSYLGAVEIPEGYDCFFAIDGFTTGGVFGSWNVTKSSANFNPSTTTYTAPADGYYLVQATSRAVSGTAILNEGVLRLNGSKLTGFSIQQEGNGSHWKRMVGHNLVLIQMTAGDTLDMIATGWDQTAGRFGVAQLPSTMVMFSAYKASFSSPTSPTTITGWTERLNPNSYFDASTGIFTAPKTGSYLFFGVSEDWNSGAVETNGLIITPNLTAYARGYEAFPHREPNGVIVMDNLTEGQTVVMQAKGQGGGLASFGAIRLA